MSIVASKETMAHDGAMKELRAWLKSNGMSQGELARQLGTDRWQVSRWIRGHVTPSGAAIVKIHKLTKIPLITLLGGK